MRRRRDKSAMDDMDAVCRACLRRVSGSHDQHFLFETADCAQQPASYTFAILTSIQVQPSDGLPAFLCSDCQHKLVTFQEFRAMCLQSDEQLRSDQYVRLQSTDVLIKADDDEELTVLNGSNDDDRISTSADDDADYSDNEVIDTPQSDDAATTSRADHRPKQLAHSAPRLSRVLKFECDMCGRGFKLKRSLEAHLRTHVGLKPFSCDQCAMSFSQFSSLQRHQQRKHPSPEEVASRPKVPVKYACEVDACSKSYVSRDALRIHVQRVHCGEPREARLVCETCGQGFASNYALREHSYRHMDASRWPHPCHLCPKRFIQKVTLQTHLKRHLKIKDYACALCETRTCTKGELETHMLSHNKELTEECAQCGKKFTSKLNMIRHTRSVHEGRKPYACQTCGRAFGTKRKFVEHTMRHTGEKPHACEICDKRFIHRFALKTHMKVHLKKGLVPHL